MTRITASVLAAAFLATGALAAPAPEAARGRVPEYEASARVTGKIGPLEPVGELAGRWQHEGLKPYRALTLGAYGRAHRNLKLGLFHRVQYGARHDDDWNPVVPGQWAWRDSTNRPEHLVILDATPRASLGGSFVGAFKVRYEHNFFNGQRAVRLEPELSWFWMDGLNPKATISARYGRYIPLNFGDASWWEQTWYLAGLWHANPGLTLGPTVALRDEVWSTSGAFLDATGGSRYRVLRRSLVWGFALIVRP